MNKIDNNLMIKNVKKNFFLIISIFFSNNIFWQIKENFLKIDNEIITNYDIRK